MIVVGGAGFMRHFGSAKVMGDVMPTIGGVLFLIDQRTDDF
jgi:hypothetical protein